jgi:hypothetical protein
MHENPYFDAEADEAQWDRESDLYDQEKDRALIDKLEEKDRAESQAKK